MCTKLGTICLIYICYDSLLILVNSNISFLDCLNSQKTSEYQQITIVSEDCQSVGSYWPEASLALTMSVSCASLKEIAERYPWNTKETKAIFLLTVYFPLDSSSYWQGVILSAFDKKIVISHTVILIIVVEDPNSEFNFSSQWAEQIKYNLENMEHWEFYYRKYEIVVQKIEEGVYFNPQEPSNPSNNFSDCAAVGRECQAMVDQIESKLKRRQNLRNASLEAHVLMTPESMSENNVTQGESGLIITNTSFSFRILQDLIYTLNFSLAYSVGGEIKRWSNGTLKGNTAEGLLNGSLDITISHSTMLPYRAKFLRFLQPTIRSRIEAVFIQPSAGSARNIYTSTFNFHMWICIGVILICTILAMRAIWLGAQNYNLASTEEDELIQKETGIWGLGLLLQQGWHYSPVFIPLRIVFIVGYLFGLLCYVAYCAAIVSRLAVPVIPIKSFNELLDSGLKALVPNDSTTMNYFLEGLVKTRKNPNIAAPMSQEDALTKIRNYESYSLIGLTFYIFRIVRNLEFEDSWVCSHLTIMPANNDLTFSAMVVPKESPFAELFSYRIMRLKELGLLYRYVTHYNLGVYVYCLPKSSTHEILSLNDVYFAFFAIIIGLILSLAALCFEILFFAGIHRNYTSKSENQQSQYFL